MYFYYVSELDDAVDVVDVDDVVKKFPIDLLMFPNAPVYPETSPYTTITIIIITATMLQIMYL